MMKGNKRAFNVMVPIPVLDDLERTARSHGLDRNAYGVMVLTKFSNLKPEHALRALASIPDEYFKARPGRPPKESEPATG